MKLTIRRTMAAVASAAAATALLTTAPPATALPIEKLTVDTDSFYFVNSIWPSTTASLSGTATVILQGGNVQVVVNAKLSRPSSQTGCRAARALFTYADGSTVASGALRPSVPGARDHHARRDVAILDQQGPGQVRRATPDRDR